MEEISFITQVSKSGDNLVIIVPKYYGEKDLIGWMDTVKVIVIQKAPKEKAAETVKTAASKSPISGKGKTK